MSLPNPFNTLQTFTANGASHQFYSLPALEKAGFKVSRLPVSIRLVLESLLPDARYDVHTSKLKLRNSERRPRPVSFHGTMPPPPVQPLIPPVPVEPQRMPD